MPSHTIAGPAAAALHTLTLSQVAFIESLPKAELHAHLSGSIPIPVLQELAMEHSAAAKTDEHLDEGTRAGLGRLQTGSVVLDTIHDFFGLFPAIYMLTSTPDSLARATRGVLNEFLDGEAPQCTYIELRTTPRETPSMSRSDYIRTVLDEVEKYPARTAALIVSLDRRMDERVIEECVEIVKDMKAGGRRVVGVDLCGDPTAGDVGMIVRHLKELKRIGVRMTVHIAETAVNSPEETLELLSCQPDRLGHATFLADEARNIVLERKTCIEICLSSNLLCKTVSTLNDHHIRFYLQRNHPISISTDDILPFRNSVVGEYALLMAEPPFGLGLAEEELRRVAEMSMDCRFR